MARRVVDHTEDRALHKQLADIIREEINNGTLPPGAQIASESRLCQIHEVGRETVRTALAMLRTEGLVRTASGYGTFVREPREREIVTLKKGDRVIARMPTPTERKELGIAEGVPILVVTNGDSEHIYAGDRTMLQA